MSTLRETLKLQQNAIEGLREQRKELLEALKDVIGLAGCQISGPNYDECVARVTRAAAVIAKAEGLA